MNGFETGRELRRDWLARSCFLACPARALVRRRYAVSTARDHQPLLGAEESNRERGEDRKAFDLTSGCLVITALVLTRPIKDVLARQLAGPPAHISSFVNMGLKLLLMG